MKMKRLLRTFEHNGEKYEINLIKRQDGTYFVKDFKGGIPFSPFYWGIDDKLNILDISKIETMLEQPIVDYFISESEAGARHWADNKHRFGY
jgi:hypothetical protein